MAAFEWVERLRDVLAAAPGRGVVTAVAELHRACAGEPVPSFVRELLGLASSHPAFALSPADAEGPVDDGWPLPVGEAEVGALLVEHGTTLLALRLQARAYEATGALSPLAGHHLFVCSDWWETGEARILEDAFKAARSLCPESPRKHAFVVVRARTLETDRIAHRMSWGAKGAKDSLQLPTALATYAALTGTPLPPAPPLFATGRVGASGLLAPIDEAVKLDVLRDDPTAYVVVPGGTPEAPRVRYAASLFQAVLAARSARERCTVGQEAAKVAAAHALALRPRDRPDRPDRLATPMTGWAASLDRLAASTTGDGLVVGHETPAVADAKAHLLGWLRTPDARASEARALLAPAGYGKTTLLDELELDLNDALDAPGRRPVVPLRVKLADVAGASTPDEALQLAFPWLEPANRTVAWQDLRREVDVALLLDGLDEVAPGRRRPVVRLWLELLLFDADGRRGASRHRLLVASRLDAYTDLADVDVACLLPLDEAQARAHAVSRGLEAPERLLPSGLWRVPLYLDLACRLRPDDERPYDSVDAFLDAATTRLFAGRGAPGSLEAVERVAVALAAGEAPADEDLAALEGAGLVRHAPGARLPEFAHRVLHEWGLRRALLAASRGGGAAAVHGALRGELALDVVERWPRGRFSPENESGVGTLLLDAWRARLGAPRTDPSADARLLAAALELLRRARLAPERAQLLVAQLVTRFDELVLEERVELARWAFEQPGPHARAFALGAWLGPQRSGLLRRLALGALQKGGPLYVARATLDAELRAWIARHASDEARLRTALAHARQTRRHAQSRRRRLLGGRAEALLVARLPGPRRWLGFAYANPVWTQFASLGLALPLLAGALVLADRHLFGGTDCALHWTGLASRELFTRFATISAAVLLTALLSLAIHPLNEWALKLSRRLHRVLGIGAHAILMRRARARGSRLAGGLALADELRAAWGRVGDPLLDPVERIDEARRFDALLVAAGVADGRRSAALESMVAALRARRRLIEPQLARGETPALDPWRQAPEACDHAYDHDLQVEQALEEARPLVPVDAAARVELPPFPPTRPPLQPSPRLYVALPLLALGLPLLRELHRTAPLGRVVGDPWYASSFLLGAALVASSLVPRLPAHWRAVLLASGSVVATATWWLVRDRLTAWVPYGFPFVLLGIGAGPYAVALVASWVDRSRASLGTAAWLVSAGPHIRWVALFALMPALLGAARPYLSTAEAAARLELLLEALAAEPDTDGRELEALLAHDLEELARAGWRAGAGGAEDALGLLDGLAGSHPDGWAAFWLRLAGHDSDGEAGRLRFLVFHRSMTTLVDTRAPALHERFQAVTDAMLAPGWRLGQSDERVNDALRWLLPQLGTTRAMTPDEVAALASRLGTLADYVSEQEHGAVERACSAAERAGPGEAGAEAFVQLAEALRRVAAGSIDPEKTVEAHHDAARLDCAVGRPFEDADAVLERVGDVPDPRRLELLASVCPLAYECGRPTQREGYANCVLNVNLALLERLAPHLPTTVTEPKAWLDADPGRLPLLAQVADTTLNAAEAALVTGQPLAGDAVEFAVTARAIIAEATGAPPDPGDHVLAALVLGRDGASRPHLDAAARAYCALPPGDAARYQFKALPEWLPLVGRDDAARVLAAADRALRTPKSGGFSSREPADALEALERLDEVLAARPLEPRVRPPGGAAAVE